MTTETYSKASIYPPTFSGKEKDWPFYRKKMESYLAYQDCGVLFGAEGDDVRPDNRTWDPNENADVAEEHRSLIKKNRKAAGIILNSINVETEKGKAAFALVETYHNAQNHFAGGHFKQEWEALCEWYEDVEGDAVDVLKEEYYKERMEQDEQPSIFIVRMKTKKILLARKDTRLRMNSSCRMSLLSYPKVMMGNLDRMMW
jgi:hypothetical protein